MMALSIGIILNGGSRGAVPSASAASENRQLESVVGLHAEVIGALLGRLVPGRGFSYLPSGSGGAAPALVTAPLIIRALLRGRCAASIFVIAGYPPAGYRHHDAPSGMII